MPKVDDRRKEYDILGLDCYATEVEVKKAFTRLSLKYHPDQIHSKGIDQESQQINKIKFNEICKAYKKIMADEHICVGDWSNDKSDEMFLSLLGELLQNSTRTNELYSLLSSRDNNKTHFQNDNEYRCKEDVVEEDDETDLNRLVDILKNRLQNGKSVPAGITQDRLAKLKDDFMKRNEEIKKLSQCQTAPSKKVKTATPVPVAKPKPKSKKQLQAEQRRRELEMANIAKELEEKKKKEEEKEQARKKQEEERQRILEEEIRRQEEDKRRQLHETKKKKEKDEKEKEQRTAKERERQEKIRKSQEEEARKKEEEKRRKAEEKSARQKAMKEQREREERERLEKQQKNQVKQRSQQFQQYQQQQQKYPREVPPRFLRQQQMKNQSNAQRKEIPNNLPNTTDNDYSNTTTDNNLSSWNDSRTYFDNAENWDVEENDNTPISNSNLFSNSWGRLPTSKDWDDEINTKTRSSVPLTSANNTETDSFFGRTDISFSNTNTNADASWGESLTGSSWATPNASVKHWDVEPVHVESKTMRPDNDLSDISNFSKTSVTNKIPVKQTVKSDFKSVNTAPKSGSPGITSWAGLDSFDNIPANPAPVEHAGGARPKIKTGSFQSIPSDNSDKMKYQNTSAARPEETHKKSLSNLDGKVDSNLKVTGWLQTTPQDEWGNENAIVGNRDVNDEEFGWTTVKTKKVTVPTSSNSNTAAPSNQPSNTASSNIQGSNAWTNRALKQLLDMGFKRELAEKALRDNNGIIESAVSDLLMKCDPSDVQPDFVEEKSAGKSTPTTTTPNGTPQKLNRKQRRKLQQMQNAATATPDQSKPQAQAAVNTPQKQLDLSQTSVHVNQDTTKPKGDGLLPTPPASQRLVPPEKLQSNELSTNSRAKPPQPQQESSFKPIARPTPQPPIAPSSPAKSEIPKQPVAPIGSARPSSQATSQPTGQAPIQPPSKLTSQSATTENSPELTNTTPLQPPMNPVLMAQRHLQQLGIRDEPPSGAFPPPSSSNVSNPNSQAVTNSMIQQYLQQIAQTSEIEPTRITPSAINTPLLQSSIGLSGLLPQAPIPASSLSDGPQKSKLLQWTQPSSGNNSEPATPPLTEDDKSSAQKVDPVSAKWGVVAAPRLSPTPAEFKPGVPWKPRGEPDGKSDDVDSVKENEGAGSENFGSTPSHSLPTSPVQNKSFDPAPKAQIPQQQLSSSNVMSQNKQSPMPSVIPSPVMNMRTPPGLNFGNTSASPSFIGGMKPQSDDPNGLILRGISSAVDPSTIRSLCQQFGSVLRFRVIGNTAYILYESPAQSNNACTYLNGHTMFNTVLYAEVSTEQDCMKAMEATALALNNSLQASHTSQPQAIHGAPMMNQFNQHSIPPQQAFSSVSPFGGSLWTTSAQPNANIQPYMQQSIPTANTFPTTHLAMGNFNHWTVPSNQPILTSGSQLWGTPVPNQPQAFASGWVANSKQEIHSTGATASMFSPAALDRCLPSELFTAKQPQNS